MMKEKRFNFSVLLNVVLFLAVIGMGVYIFTAANTDKTPIKNDTGQSENIKPVVTVRVFRFFSEGGGDEHPAADFYTSLRLKSDGSFVFYVNNCEGVSVEKGKYTETNKEIKLTFEDKQEMVIPKVSENELDLSSYKHICIEPNGAFKIESFIYND